MNERVNELTAGVTSPTYVDEFVTSHDGLRLLKAFMRIRLALQRRIVALVNEIAGESGE